MNDSREYGLLWVRFVVKRIASSRQSRYRIAYQPAIKTIYNIIKENHPSYILSKQIHPLSYAKYEKTIFITESSLESCMQIKHLVYNCHEDGNVYI